MIVRPSLRLMDNQLRLSMFLNIKTFHLYTFPIFRQKLKRKLKILNKFVLLFGRAVAKNTVTIIVIIDAVHHNFAVFVTANGGDFIVIN